MKLLDFVAVEVRGSAGVWGCLAESYQHFHQHLSCNIIEHKFLQLSKKRNSNLCIGDSTWLLIPYKPLIWIGSLIVLIQTFDWMWGIYLGNGLLTCHDLCNCFYSGCCVKCCLRWRRQPAAEFAASPESGDGLDRDFHHSHSFLQCHIHNG